MRGNKNGWVRGDALWVMRGGLDEGLRWGAWRRLVPTACAAALWVATAAAAQSGSEVAAGQGDVGARVPEGAAQLPAVQVRAAQEAPKDPLITQTRAASVGKSQIPVQETPFSMELIDTEQIRETGAKNVQDALLYSAGVYAGRYGFDTRGDWAAIRGLSPAAYINGLRGDYGFYNSVRPDIYTLESIEVLKGPASVLYGQAALGGIVNVVTKQPKAQAAREVEVQFGSFARKQIATDLTGPMSEDGRWLYRLVALKRDSDTQVDFVNDDALAVMPSLTWQPVAGQRVTLQYLHQQNNSKVSAQFLPSKGTIDPAPLGQIPAHRFVGEPSWDRYDTRKNELSLLLDHELAGAWHLAASLRKSHSASVTREHWTRVGAVPDDAGNIARTIHSADRKTAVLAGDVRLSKAVQWGPTKHQFVLGVEYQNAFWEEFNYGYSAAGGGTINVYDPVYGVVNSLALADRPDSKIMQTGVYVMDHVRWGPWIVSGALRRDAARNETLALSGTSDVARNDETTGRLGLMLQLPNGVAPYVSYAEAFVPNLGTDGTAAANRLAPTTGEQTEAGLKYVSASGHASGTFAWFDIKETNRIVDGVTPQGVEQVGAVTQGWEAQWRQRLGVLEFLGNYTHMSALNAATQKRLSSIAEKTASGWGLVHLSDHWRVGLGARYIGPVTGGSGVPVLPSVTLYDAMLGYTTGPWQLRLDVKNLADKTYVSWCRGLNLDCGYGELRNATLTAKYAF